MAEVHDPVAEYDAGLVVVHGVGQHAKGSFLTRAVGPLLGRMRAEDSLRSVRSLSYDPGVDGTARMEALDVCYQTTADGPEKRLLVVEGRWSDAYTRAGPPQVSAWVFRHELPMLWGVLKYFARGWKWFLAALAAFGFLAAALVALVRGDGDSVAAVVLLSVSIALAVTLGTSNFSWRTPNQRGLFLGVLGSMAAFVAIAGATLVTCWAVFSLQFGWGGGAGAVALYLASGAIFIKVLANWPKAQWAVLGFRLVPLAAFTYQRAVVIILTALGMVLLPILTALLRIIAAIPGVGLVGLKGLQKLEETFFVGSNFGDMHAFADSPARFARIASAVEQALVNVELRVKPGGTVTVLAHSGGAVVAWVLLTQPFAAERLADRRYRIIVVGAALNWAQCGFDEPDLPPIDQPFANAGGPNPTLGAHIYGTWDAVPHGAFRPGANEPAPIIPGRFNIPSRNLGEPSLSEHGEYWNNQEDVVPVIGRAIDDSIDWVEKATNNSYAWNLRANARLGVVAVLTRVRVALLLAPLVALVLLLASPLAQNPDARQVPDESEANTTAARGNINLLYRAADQFGDKLGACFTVSERDATGTRLPLSKDAYYGACQFPGPVETTLWFLFRHATAGNMVFVVIIWLLALGLLGAYRDLFWRIGGRTDASLTHKDYGIAIETAAGKRRFTATWIGLGILPGLLWLVPVLAIHATVELDQLVYAIGLSLSAAIAFAEWTYVRTLVEAARVVDRGELETHELRELYELLGSDVGRARAAANPAVDLDK